MVYKEGTTLEIFGGRFKLLADWDTDQDTHFPLYFEDGNKVYVKADALPIIVIEEKK